MELKDLKDWVAFRLGEKSMEDEALMEVLSNGHAALTTHLIDTVVETTLQVLKDGKPGV